MAKVLLCGKLFDAIEGNVQENMAVVIEGKHIRQVISQASFQASPEDELVDLSDRFVMPGLIDAHVHLAMSGFASIKEPDEPAEFVAAKALKNARDNLMGGFTTVRDEGYFTVQGCQSIRDAINAGFAEGPRIFTSGMVITQTAGHLEPRWTQERFGFQTFKPVNVANSPDEVVTAARYMLKMGADQIKIMVTGGVLSKGTNVGEQNMSDEEIRAAVSVGKMHDRVVSVHAHGTEGIKAAARAGVTVIEHCTTVDDEGIALMVQNNVALVPTFIVLKLIAEKGAAAGVSADAVGKSAALAPQHLHNVKKAYDAGVRVVFGTDTGTPLGYHGTQHAEFILMEQAGIAKKDILLAATRYAAELLRWQADIGTVEVGKFADIVALQGDPFADMAAMANITFIMKDGDIYKHQA
jgi:imidazolonepropionase-like amidohydrolase